MTFDSQGYPESMGGNSYIQMAMLYGYPFGSHQYLIKYSGDRVHPIANAGTITNKCGGLGGGTITDKTAGRLVLQMPPGNDQMRICITSTDPNRTGNYIRDIAVIDCGNTPYNCSNEALWQNCNYIQRSCLNPAWVALFGTKHVGGPGFTSYRFMDWMNTNNVSNGTFADRSTPNWLSYAAHHREVTGVPLEAIASVLDQTCADGWINVPAAGIAVDTDGTFTGSISGGSGSGTLTASGIKGRIGVGDYLQWSGTTQYGLYVSASLGEEKYTVIMPGGGAVKSQSSISMTAAYVNTSYIQSMATVMRTNLAWCNTSQKLRVEVGNETWNFTPYGYNYFGNLAQSLWGIGGRDGGYSFRGMITALAGSIFKTTFGSQSDHIEAVLNTQSITDPNYATDGHKLIVAPYWSGTPAYTKIDALVIANYYTLVEYNVPSNWLSLSDGGVSNLLTEFSNGGLVNNQIKHVSSAVKNSGGSGYVNGTYGWVPLVGGFGQGARCYFAVAGGVPSCDMGNGQANGGQNYFVGDTLTVDNVYLGGSGSGWSGTVETVTGNDTYEGQITYSANLVSLWKAYAANYNLKLYDYEGGEQFLLNNGASPIKKLLCAWDTSAGAQKFTRDYLGAWRRVMGPSAVFHYFNDVASCGYPSSWGLLYYPSQGSSSSPTKYRGALQQLQFLLKRDLAPASNDNTPVWLERTG